MTIRFKTKAKNTCLKKPIQSTYKNQALANYANLEVNSNLTTAKKHVLNVASGLAKKRLLGRWVSLTCDQKRRNQFYVRELEKTLLKAYGTSYQNQRPEQERLKRQNGLKHFGFHQMLVVSNYRKAHKKQGTVTRVRNRCVLSGRAHIVRHLGLSRICFRTLAGWGFIPGLTKI